MNTLKFTPWFTKNKTPCYEGVYSVLHIERNLDGSSWQPPMFANWNGRTWGSMRPSINEALSFSISKKIIFYTWRGILND